MPHRRWFRIIQKRVEPFGCALRRGQAMAGRGSRHFQSAYLFLAMFVIALPGYAAQQIISEWFKQYESIENPAASAFVDRGLILAKELLGEPRFPVHKVQLRESTPIDPASNIRKNFQLCEITDLTNGVFTIYLSRRLGEYAFYGQLAHEIAHMLNAQLFDVYVEGLNTAFAERFLLKEGRDWSGWAAYLKRGDPFYGSTYTMMKQVWDIVGDQQIKTLLSFAVYTDAARTKMHIGINAWIDSLPSAQRLQVRTIITESGPAIREAMKDHSDYAFTLPR